MTISIDRETGLRSDTSRFRTILNHVVPQLSSSDDSDKVRIKSKWPLPFLQLDDLDPVVSPIENGGTHRFPGIERDVSRTSKLTQAIPGGPTDFTDSRRIFSRDDSIDRNPFCIRLRDDEPRLSNRPMLPIVSGQIDSLPRKCCGSGWIFGTTGPKDLHSTLDRLCDEDALAVG